MKKILISFMVMIIIVGCGTKKQIRITGSTSMMAELALYVNDYNTDIEFLLKSGGSQKGVDDLAKGYTDIAMVSSNQIVSNFPSITLKNESIKIIVAENIGIVDLSESQLFEIFSGKIKNWSEVGGSDTSIKVISREDMSGTRKTFETTLGLFDSKGKSQVVNSNPDIAYSNEDVIRKIQTIDGAIGYVSNYVSDNNTIKINNISSRDDNYLLNTTYYLYYDDSNKEVVEFIKYINKVK